MDLTGIISISGRPGLYKVIAQGKNSIIVESLSDRKRFPAYASDRISALDDISIYTYEEDKPLREIFADIYAKQNGGECPSHKEDVTALRDYFQEILPNFDEERVYPSDIKKLFQWYNMLHKAGNLTPVETPAEEPATEESAPKKKAPAKAAKKTADGAEKETTTAKPKAAAKKAPKATEDSAEKEVKKKAPAAKKTTAKK